MTDKEKTHKISVAYNSIRKVLEDTDEELWAYDFLTDAIVALNLYFEESDI